MKTTSSTGRSPDGKVTVTPPTVKGPADGKALYGQEPRRQSATIEESITSYFSNATEITQWVIPNCSQQQPATVYGVLRRMIQMIHLFSPHSYCWQ